ncbi:MAG: T9SS type A sorting domain-containing protein, partial [Bacteroidota bacterium]
VGASINEFTRYPLQSSVILSDTFFIGYQQSVNEYIGIGFDRSNPEASQYIFENRTGVWEQNRRLTGALMIRPVFSSVDSLVTGIQSSPKLTVYPNPTKGWLTIDGEYQSISLIDFSGRKWLQERSKSSHDLTDFPRGLYLLIIHRKEGDQTLKIIKE